MNKSKKGVSVIIGYVLLISFGIIMSVIVYNYLKTYVPKDLPDCPDGVSIFLKNYSCSGNQLNISLKNNGKFNLEGYFIHAANFSSEKIATIDISSGFSNTSVEGFAVLSTIYFHRNVNESFKPNEEGTYNFDLNNSVGLIEIIPVRIQTEENRERFISCGSAKIREALVCN